MTLPNGQGIKYIQGEPIPEVGFGAWHLYGAACRHGVDVALQVGYRHLDTAGIYQNESDVAKGMRRSGVSREDIFITSQLWCVDDAIDAVEREVERSLQSLKTEYLDLILIRVPNPDQQLHRTLDGINKLKQQKKIRFYGVIDFNRLWLQDVLREGQVICDQIEMHVLLRKRDLRRLAAEHDVLLTAYSPLARGQAGLLFAMSFIADKHRKSPEQIALRWLIEQENVAFVMPSLKKKEIEANIDLYDFNLDEEDHLLISQLPDWEHHFD